MFQVGDGQTAVFARVVASRASVYLEGDEVQVVSTLDVEVDAPGAPVLFALTSRPESVQCGGIEVGSVRVGAPCPNGVWATGVPLPPGRRRLTIRSPLCGVFGRYDDAFFGWVRTSDGRSGTHYFDRIAAAGFEHDAYPITLEVHRVPPAHDFVANGAVTRRGDVVKVRFPDWYSPSCPWWVMAPPSLPRAQWIAPVPWAAFDGRTGPELPVTVLAESRDDLAVVEQRTRDHLAKLVDRFGPWRHHASSS